MRRRRLSFAAALLLAFAALPACADALIDFNIGEQSADKALVEFARQASVSVLFPTQRINAARAHAVHGRYRVEEALEILLKDTGLSAGVVAGQAGTGSITVTIKQEPGDPSMKLTKTSNWLLAALSSAVSAVLSTTARAEQAGAQPSAEALEEIVVTAQKREERASNVPQSITAVGGQALRAANVQDLADLSAIVPGLTIFSTGGVGQNQIILRGITSGSDISPSVSVYVDDVPFGGITARSVQVGTAFETGSFDLSRVEVLRGPQGTLYGAAAFGGIVKYALTPPSLRDFQASVQLDGSDTAGGGFNNGLRTAVNLPLVTDELAVRVSFIRNHDAGFIRNVFNGDSRVNRSTTTAARISLLAKPNDWLTLRATALGQDITRDGTNQVDFTPSPSDPASASPAFGDQSQSSRVRQGFEQRSRLYSIGADADLGFGQASTTVAYQTVRTDQITEAPIYVGIMSPVVEALGYSIDDTIVRPTPASHITTAEARLQSNPNSAFEWLGGLFYTKEGNTFSNYLKGFLNGAPVPVDMLTYHSPTTYKEYAAFGDITYHFTQRLDAGVGVRFSHNSQDIAQTYSGLISGPSVSGIRSDESVKTYLATLRYHLTESSMLYARAASGYRPGGPNVQVTDPVTGQVQGAAAFRSDSLWNYEVGLKLSPFHNFTVDLSVFQINWKSIQLITVVDGFSAYVNGGRAKSDGLETTLAYQPLAGLTLSASAAYANARLSDEVPDIGAKEGERLPIAPRISATLAVDYKAALGADWSGFAGGGFSFVGARTTGFNGTTGVPQYNLPSYETLNLRLGAAHGGLELMLYAKNVFNKLGQNSADTTTYLPFYRISILQPRTLGAQVTVNF